MQAVYALRVNISTPRHLRRHAKLQRLIKKFGASNLAVDVKTPKSHISALASGTRGIGDQLAAKLDAFAVERMGVEPGWIDSPDAAAETAAHAEIANPTRDQLWALFEVLPESERSEVFEALRRRSARVLGDRLLAERFGVTSYAGNRQVEKAFGPVPRDAERRDPTHEDTRERRRATDES